MAISPSRGSSDEGQETAGSFRNYRAQDEEVSGTSALARRYSLAAYFILAYVLSIVAILVARPARLSLRLAFDPTAVSAPA